MQQRSGVVRYQDRPVTLLGPELKVGDVAPAFQVVDVDLAPVSLADFAGRIKIVCSVPSLDTPVCKDQIRRFNREAAGLPETIVVLFISLDLPFAQQRWCTTSGIERVKILSDYQDRSFGTAYGVLIKELKLLSRTIFVIDADDRISYIQQVPELIREPDYAAVLAAAKSEINIREIPGDGFCGAY